MDYNPNQEVSKRLVSVFKPQYNNPFITRFVRTHWINPLILTNPTGFILLDAPSDRLMLQLLHPMRHRCDRWESGGRIVKSSSLGPRHSMYGMNAYRKRSNFYGTCKEI